MEILSDLLDALSAVLFSALSAMGVGGGSLLLIYLTELRGFEQAAAQSVNLLCFLAAGVSAIPFYHRSGYLKERKTVVWLLLFGIPTALVGARIAAALPQTWARKCFGGFLILTALYSLFRDRKHPKPAPISPEIPQKRKKDSENTK